MSHTTEIRAIKIVDANALKQAAVSLKARGVNCELITQGKPRMYYRHQEVQCDYVLKLLDGKYDVGFQKQADGSYAPIFDKYRNYVGAELSVPNACAIPTTSEEKAMHQLGMFGQEYGRHAAVNVATAQGFYVESSDYDSQGNLQLVLAR